MSRSTTFQATYRIVTPMFCGGADPEVPELRIPSLKGALRFWWRSLQWGKVRDADKLWEKESKLFGASDQKIGQSKVQMRLVEDKTDPPCRKGQIFERGQRQGAHYLGYGVMEAFASSRRNTQSGQLTRGMIPGGTFTVALRCKLQPDQLEEVRNALLLLGTVGGLGSKTRKGFGSLTLVSLQCEGEAIALADHPRERLARILNVERPNGGLPAWTAWSPHARVLSVTGDDSPIALLDNLGRELVHFRSWGNNGQVLGRESERNFPEDHDLSKGKSPGISHPKRVVFGLPHNYGSHRNDQVTAVSRDRRASPLFFHIHQTTPAQPPCGVVTFLPSLFLPEREQLRAFGSTVDLDRSEQFWQPIRGFLDRLLDKHNATKKKTGLKAEEVHLV